MKRILLSFLISVSLIFSADTAHSAIKTGNACKSIGQVSIFNGFSYTCLKSGSKLIWGKGEKVGKYNATFAKEILAEAQYNSSQILAAAKLEANQVKNPPNCIPKNLKANASIGSDAGSGLKALVFENPGICDLVVSTSASFLCPDGKVQKISNAITSTGVFTLQPSEKISVSYNFQRYFPKVLTDCLLLTGYSANTVNVDIYHQAPSVVVLSAKYTGVFNQVAANKKADQIIKSAKISADKILADAKNPALILKAWNAALEAKRAAIIQAEAEAKTRADRFAQDAGLGKKCVVGTSCLIGSTGPGGGVVFFDAGSQQIWGRYLEFAPYEWDGQIWWNGDEPGKPLCRSSSNVRTSSLWITDKGLIDKVTRGTEVGAGKANTEAIVSGCSTFSGVQAIRAYRGGGASDWYLPSKDELNEFCKYVRHQVTGDAKIQCNYSGDFRAGFKEGPFWSSSEYDDNYGLAQDFNGGSQAALLKDGYAACRPIRAF
jgi:hypothetical protein